MLNRRTGSHTKDLGTKCTPATSEDQNEDNSGGFWVAIFGLCLGFGVFLLLAHFGILDGILSSFQ